MIGRGLNVSRTKRRPKGVCPVGAETNAEPLPAGGIVHTRQGGIFSVSGLRIAGTVAEQRIRSRRIRCGQAFNIGGKRRRKLRNQSRRGHIAAQSLRLKDASAFIVEEEEQPVSHDWTADVASELVPAKRRLLEMIQIREVVICVENVVSKVLPDSAVEFVGSGL